MLHSLIFPILNSVLQTSTTVCENEKSDKDLGANVFQYIFSYAIFPNVHIFGEQFPLIQCLCGCCFV